ncbi:MAG: hypothetical protein U9P63_02725 [Patescibacteria group bacterium]|nr:hypothetical protein [Patescibacteria group bacterium]
MLFGKEKLIFIFLCLVVLSALFYVAPFYFGGASASEEAYLPKVDLIKGSAPEVYLLAGGIKRWIPNPEIFNLFNYSWNNIKVFSDSVVESYPQGGDWDKYDDYPDGSLLRGSGPEVYLIELGKKRWIPNPRIFTESGFGWKYIVSVDNDILDDFDDGNNLTLSEPNKYPETIILEGPEQDEVLESVDISFTYSGTNPLGAAKDLTFETYLEGYDSRWHKQRSNYTEEYDLSSESRSYTFYVRAKNAEGYIDCSPASRTFRIGVSPYYGDVEIDDISYDEDDFKDDYLVLENNSDNLINIGGWTIKTKNETVTIPKAIHKLRHPVSANIPSDIKLASDDKVIISLRISPQGENFRINKCAGYLDQYGQFEPPLDEDCPELNESEYSHLKSACRDFIDNLDRCEIPDYSDNYKVGSDSECTGFLNDRFNYRRCYEDHEQEADFFGDEWRVFLGKSIDIFDNDGDKVILRDGSGLLVDEYSY